MDRESKVMCPWCDKGEIYVEMSMSSIIPVFFLLSTAAKIQKRNFSNISLGEIFVF